MFLQRRYDDVMTYANIIWMCPLSVSNSIQRSLQMVTTSFGYFRVAHAQHLIMALCGDGCQDLIHDQGDIPLYDPSTLQESIADLQCLHSAFRMWMLIFIVTTYLKKNIIYLYVLLPKVRQLNKGQRRMHATVLVAYLSGGQASKKEENSLLAGEEFPNMVVSVVKWPSLVFRSEIRIISVVIQGLLGVAQE